MLPTRVQFMFGSQVVQLWVVDKVNNAFSYTEYPIDGPRYAWGQMLQGLMDGLVERGLYTKESAGTIIKYELVEVVD